MEPQISIGIDGSNIRGGGGIKHICEVLRHADPKSFGIKQVIVWAPSSIKEEYPERDWLEVIGVPQFEKSLLHRFFWRKFPMKKQLEQRCDVLFVPGGISLRTKIPDVVMSQNMQPFVEGERKSVKWGRLRIRLELLRQLQGRSISKATARVFLTDFAREVIQAQFPFPDSDNAEIPHGIDDCFFADRTEAAKPLDPNKEFKIVYVSTINVYKHQLEVVNAAAKLAAKWPSISLSLVGGVYDSEYHEKVTRRIEEVNAELGRNVIQYVGKVPFLELPDIYRKADLAVFASSCENLPNILLESMASGLPIVTSTYPPMPQVLEEGGLYCDVNSGDSIASAIEKYLVDPALRDEKAQIANDLARKYSWKKTADMTLELLARVARDNLVAKKRTG